MAKASYDSCLQRLLVHEGGYSNAAGDPGGPTNFGITIYDYRKYINAAGTAADVRAMKLSDAKAIYRSKYWDALRCDDLPAGVDDSIFDYGVNSGIARAGKVLRRVLGLPASDWHVTADVLAALAKRDPKVVIGAINTERLMFLQGLKTWPIFGRGWGRRVAEVRAFSLQLASGVAPVMPAANDNAKGKGMVPAPTAIKKVIVAGGGGAGAASTIHPATQSFIAAHPIEAGLFVVGGVLVIGGAVYALNRWHQARQEAPTPNAPVVPMLAAA